MKKAEEILEENMSEFSSKYIDEMPAPGYKGETPMLRKWILDAMQRFAAQSPAISRERLVEIINSKLYVQKDNGNTFEVYPAMEIKGVDGAADAILSELGAEPEQPKNDEAIEIVKKLADWSEKYPRDPIYPKSRMSMDEELIEIEKAAKEFCGKCGKKK